MTTQHATTCDLLVRNGDCTCAPTRDALQLKAIGDRCYLLCPRCWCVVHAWQAGAAVTVPQVIVAEQQHLAAVHTTAPDYSAIYDGIYQDGLG